KTLKVVVQVMKYLFSKERPVASHKEFFLPVVVGVPRSAGPFRIGKIQSMNKFRTKDGRYLDTLPPFQTIQVNTILKELIFPLSAIVPHPFNQRHPTGWGVVDVEFCCCHPQHFEKSKVTVIGVRIG